MHTPLASYFDFISLFPSLCHIDSTGKVYFKDGKDYVMFHFLFRDPSCLVQDPHLSSELSQNVDISCRNLQDPFHDFQEAQPLSFPSSSSSSTNIIPPTPPLSSNLCLNNGCPTPSHAPSSIQLGSQKTIQSSSSHETIDNIEVDV